MTSGLDLARLEDPILHVLGAPERNLSQVSRRHVCVREHELFHFLRRQALRHPDHVARLGERFRLISQLQVFACFLRLLS